jgi:hypothetical protein
MPDRDPTPVIIAASFQPPVSRAQLSLAMRYGALRSALGKVGRYFGQHQLLVIPAPTLFLPATGAAIRPLLRFHREIPGARSVAVLDANLNQVGPLHPFTAAEPIEVDDPGPGATVEILARKKVPFMVGVPERVVLAQLPGGV